MRWLTQRRLVALLRQPAVVVVTLVQPAIWLFLFGNLFKEIVQLPGFGGQSYLDYLIPGVVVMNAVSANMWAGMGVIDDIERGTLDRFLVSPVRRGPILFAGVVEQAVSTILQSALIVLLGWAAGARYPGGVVGVAVLVLASAVLGTIFGALSTALGLLLRQRESIIGLSIFLLLPLTFLSSAFMTLTLIPGWMRGVAHGNPVEWAIEASRSALAEAPQWSSVLGYGAALVGLAATLVWLSTRAFRTYQRTA